MCTVTDIIYIDVVQTQIFKQIYTLLFSLFTFIFMFYLRNNEIALRSDLDSVSSTKQTSGINLVRLWHHIHTHARMHTDICSLSSRCTIILNIHHLISRIIVFRHQSKSETWMIKCESLLRSCWTWPEVSRIKTQLVLIQPCIGSVYEQILLFETETIKVSRWIFALSDITLGKSCKNLFIIHIHLFLRQMFPCWTVTIATFESFLCVDPNTNMCNTSVQ